MKQTTDPLAKSRVSGSSSITEIIHDHTLTGAGTQASPLSVLPLQYDNGNVVFQVEDYSELRMYDGNGNTCIDIRPYRFEIIQGGYTILYADEAGTYLSSSATGNTFLYQEVDNTCLLSANGSDLLRESTDYFFLACDMNNGYFRLIDVFPDGFSLNANDNAGLYETRKLIYSSNTDGYTQYFGHKTNNNGDYPSCVIEQSYYDTYFFWHNWTTALYSNMYEANYCDFNGNTIIRTDSSNWTYIFDSYGNEKITIGNRYLELCSATSYSDGQPTPSLINLQDGTILIEAQKIQLQGIWDKNPFTPSHIMVYSDGSEDNRGLKAMSKEEFKAWLDAA